MDRELIQELRNTIWTGRSLFERDKTAGLSASMGFFHDGRMYISQSGSYFGTLKKDGLEVMDTNRECLNSGKPSREWPLYLKVYQKEPGTGAALHIHGTCGVLWSFVPAEDETDAIPDHALCLKMKLGRVGLIPYERPGSRALLNASGQRVMDSGGYLLKQRGAVVSGKNLMDVSHCLEEPEESARTAWILKRTGLKQ